MKSLLDSVDVRGMQLGPRQYLLLHVDACLHNQRLYLEYVDYEREVILDQLFSFAHLLYNSARYEEAKEIYCRALEGYQKAGLADHPSALRTVNNRAICTQIKAS